MFIRQLYTNCLAEAAYFIESDGEAIVIDPIRDCEEYLALAKERNAEIKYIFETHFHADFISGHLDLAKKTGAQIVFGPKADPSYPAHIAKDGECFKIGKLRLDVLHTPGHTPESSCFLLYNEGTPHALFSGDTLFVGDVGRPDLLDGKMTSSELASMMYDSLQKIKQLPDNVLVYPAHGPGSACGKNIGKETWSTIAQQKMTNYALGDLSKDKFIEILTEGLTPAPAYFFQDAMINKNGYDSLDITLNKALKPLTGKDILQAEGIILLDTRDPDSFEKGFIKDSINIGLNGTFAIWAASLFDIHSKLIIIADKGKEKESAVRLARVGFDNIIGFLANGIESWTETGGELETINSVSPEEFASLLVKGHGVLDVRKPGEVSQGFVEGAEIITLIDLPRDLNKMDSNKPYLVHCAGGYRSMIACSILKSKGFNNVTNVYKGFSGIKATNAPILSMETV